MKYIVIKNIFNIKKHISRNTKLHFCMFTIRVKVKGIKIKVKIAFKEIGGN